MVQNRERSLPTETLLKKATVHQGVGGGNFNADLRPNTPQSLQSNI